MKRTETEHAAYGYWLERIPGIGGVTIRRLLNRIGGPEEIYAVTKAELDSMEKEKILTPSQKKALENAKQEKHIIQDYQKLLQKGIRCIPYGSREYPGRLSQIADPPVNLYVLGKLPEENLPVIGIVGARLCSDYGRYMARQFGIKLALAGIQVVSGMAAGVDGISQSAALEAGGKSFGVLGCGVDICYPPENRPLYENLCAKGGLISEYIPGTQPKAGFFPMRNRLISGLSDFLLVIEAREKSGTLITVDRALEQGREVYVLPGRVTDTLSAGCNRLIRQGAGIALSPEDMAETIWEFWDSVHTKQILRHSAQVGLVKQDFTQTEQAKQDSAHAARFIQDEKRSLAMLKQEEQMVYACLSEEGKTTEEVYQCVNQSHPELTIGTISSILVQLCVRNCVYMKKGRFYRASKF